MRHGKCEDMGRGATAEEESRSVRTVPGLPNFFEVRVLEGPVHEVAAVLSEQGKNGRPDKFHHSGGVMFVPLDESRRLPRALENASTVPLKGECHVT